MGDEEEAIEPLFFHPGQRGEKTENEEVAEEVDDSSSSSSSDEEEQREKPTKMVKKNTTQQEKSVVKRQDDLFVGGAPAKTKKEKTAGSAWFEMRRAPLELRTDARVLEARGYANPKRFYKKTDKVSEFAQLGTVIAGPFERKKLSKRQQKSSLTAELLADKDARAFAKRKYNQLQAAKTPLRHRSKKLLAKQKHLRIGS